MDKSRYAVATGCAVAFASFPSCCFPPGPTRPTPLTHTHTHTHTATAASLALLSAGLLVGHVQAAETVPDKAAVLGSFERPHWFASGEQEERRWVQGDKAYVGTLAVHDGAWG